MSFLVRKMTATDVPAVAQLDRMSFTLPWPERSFQFEVNANPASRCYVAETDGQIVGAIVGWLLVDEMHIATLATHPDFRQQGIAQKLLAHTLRYTYDEGAATSFLEVRESNQRAIQLYQAAGFNEIGLRKNYYPTANGKENAVIMALMIF
mgnify:CR=1 FL=1